MFPMRSKRYFVIAVFMSCVVFLSAGCAKKSRDMAAGGGLKSSSDEEDMPPQSIGQKILSFNLEGYRDNGQKKWELNGANADILSSTIKLDYMTAKVYGDNESLTIKARTGLYDKFTKNIHLEKNVVGKTTDGTRLLTDRLDWNQTTECVTTDALVRIERENLSSVGRGAVGNPSLKQVELKKDVVVEIKDNPPTTITCDGPLLVDYNSHISTLHKNVRIKDQRGEIFADVMKVVFDPKTRKITRVVAIGNVRIIREGNSTNSDRVIYTVNDGRIRLVGRPRIVMFPKEAKNASAGN